MTGVCLEDTMPYITGNKKPDFTSDPTHDAELEAHKYRIPEKNFKYFRLSASDPKAWRDVPIVEVIRNALQNGSPVAVAFPVYGKSNQWSNIYSDGWRFGEVLDPRHPPDVVSVFESESVDQLIKGGHAVCIVGYLEGQNGAEGRFVFKNSWGHRFARRFDGALVPPPRPGYGTVSLSHMEKPLLGNDVSGDRRRKLRSERCFLACHQKLIEVSVFDYSHWSGCTMLR